MIELFDAARLIPRRDYSLPLAAAAVLLVLAAAGTYGWSLQTRLADVERQRAELQQRVQQLRGLPAPSSALLADLQRETERLEAEGRADPRHAMASAPPPSQWMLRMADLGSAEVSLSKIEVERGGAVRIEGLAASPQAVSRFLQHWDRTQPSATPVPARAIDVRQDPATAPLLTFKLRATAPAPTLPAAPVAAKGARS
jgi:hypothetical protein